MVTQAQQDQIFKLACVQSCTGTDPISNLAIMSDAVSEAAERGAAFVALPETCNFMAKNRDHLYATLQREEADPFVLGLQSLTKKLGIHLLLGSVVVKAISDDPDEARAANRSLLIAPDGSIAARYDKVHLFDVTLANGESHRESQNYRPGATAVIAATPYGHLGLSVCYDMRFAYLYRLLASHGADFISVPSAFTRPTGQAHWHVLLRARAIETGCFIFAPAQNGLHENGRATYGHSLIVSPWGDILAEASQNTDIGGVEIVIAEIDRRRVDQARQQIPSLQHGRQVGLSE
jgi:predicted amidohydrolase